MDEIIVLKNLTKSYGDVIKTEVLRDISVAFERGTMTAIVGPSGSGKTTLLNIISLLDAPSSGTLIINGENFSAGKIDRYSQYRNAHIGFVFQFHYLLPEFTSLENILIPYWIRSGRPSGDVIQKALRIMKEIDILPIKNKYPHQISGGEQQRVAIARALVHEPKMVFADEPTGNLDRETGSAVLDVMVRMVKELGTTLILVTHDREIALRAERILELVDGRICRSFLVMEVGKEKARQLLEDRSCLL